MYTIKYIFILARLTKITKYINSNQGDSYIILNQLVFKTSRFHTNFSIRKNKQPSDISTVVKMFKTSTTTSTLWFLPCSIFSFFFFSNSLL